MTFGARIIKTGVAVALSIYVALFFQLDPVIFAALAAVLCMQPSIYRSWQNILEQLQANLVGAILAVTFTFLLGNEPFVVGLVVMLVIAINLKLNFEKGIPIAVITVIAIMESTTGNFLLFALDRFLLIMLGILSAMLVNIAFLPPRYEDRLYNKLEHVAHELLAYLRSSTIGAYEDKIYKKELAQMKDELKAIDQLYVLYKEERTLLRKVSFTKARKLVLFQKMIKSNEIALSLLHSLEKHKTDLAYIPDDLKQLLQHELDILTSYHERILLKYEGKIKSSHPHHMVTDVFEGRDEVLDHFMHLYQSNKDDQHDHWVHLFPIFAQMINYADILERLDKLVDGYYSFHPEQSEKDHA